jgi:hypothetical protein
MPVKINGQFGKVKIASGSTNIGPSIPADGLIMIIDPALATTATSAYRLTTPLTSSVLTATTSNILPGGAVGLQNLAYPTGGGTFVYLNTGSAGTLRTIDSRNTYIDIVGDALSYLQRNVQNNLTILYWYSGFTPAISYPEVANDARPNTKFAFGLNAAPSPVFPVRQLDSATLQSATSRVATSTYGASVNRIWDVGALTTTPFETTGSMTTVTAYSSSFGPITGSSWGQGNPGPNETSSTSPNYTAHPATQNLPAFHRQLPMSSFAGRDIYRDSDTWNCIAVALNQTDKTTTSSIYINGGFYAQQRAVTGSFTAGAYSRGSVNFTTAIQNDNSNVFIISGSTTENLGGTKILLYPTASGAPADTSGLPASIRNYYFPSASTIAGTLQNLATKINNTPNLSLFFTASFILPSTIAVSSSVVGGQLNTITFNFSSSATPITNLFTFANGSTSGGSGPITTTLLQQIPSGSALRIGVTQTVVASSFFRQGLVGLLGAVYVYNRTLSQEEIIQFYNALKSRYGNTAPANVPKRTYRIFNSTISGSTGTYEDPLSGSGIGY